MQSQHYPVIRDWQVCYSNLKLTLFFKQHFHWLWHFSGPKITICNFILLLLLFLLVVSSNFFHYYFQFFFISISLYYMQFNIIISVFFSFKALFIICNFILFYNLRILFISKLSLLFFISYYYYHLCNLLISKLSLLFLISYYYYHLCNLLISKLSLLFLISYYYYYFPIHFKVSFVSH